MGVARYDGVADWYDAWARTAGAGALAAATALLVDLVPAGSGLALDVGCGTGLHADAVRGRGYAVVGVDLSADQLRLAAARLPVARADAAALPIRDSAVPLVTSVLTHTDLPAFPGAVAEAVRVLRSGGRLAYVGVHPCFVHPFAEPAEDAVRVHAGYRRAGWAPTTLFTGDAVRARVGVHHLPLADFLSAFAVPGARIDRVVEGGEGPLPPLLGVRLRRD